MELSSPQKERKSRKKLLLRIGCGALALLAALAISGWLYFRSGRFNRLLAEEITNAARDYGLRVEVGRVELGRGLRKAILHDLKIHNRETGQAVALIERAEATLEIREPFAFRLRREIALQRVDLSGVSLWVDVDENGRSNFTGVRRPHRAPGRITFDASALIVALHRGVLRLDDRRRQVSGTLNDLYTEARATKGGAISLKFGIGASPFNYKGRETSVYSLDIAAVVTGTGADIKRLTLQSPMANATAAGRVDGWNEVRYWLKTKSRVTLAEAMRVFVPNVGLKGVADFDGRVEGAGARYRASGNVTAEEVIAAGICFLGTRAEGASAGPERDEWTFSSRAARAQKVLTKGLVFNEASVAGVRGAVRQGIARLSADQADVVRFDAAQGRAETVRLQQLAATIGGGRDEVRGDLSLSNGVLGDVTFGQTHGRFVANRDVIVLSAFTSSVMRGQATGDVAVQTSRDRVSSLQAEFTKLDTNDLFPFIGVRNALIAGIADGRADVNWPGTELHDLSGAITAKISGETAKTPEPIDVTVDIAATARNGVLNFAPLTLRTEATTATATGTISLTGDAGLRLKLSSTRADELQTFAYSLDISKAALDRYQPQISGDFRFEGAITGALKDPVIDGALNASRFGLRGGMLGSLTGRVFFSPEEIRFEKGSLIADNGGSIKVAYAAPRAEEATRGRLDATIERVDLGPMLLAFGQSVKRTLVAGEVSGEAHLTGLPAAMRGVVNAELVNGTVFEQQAESVRAAVVFDRRTARLERLEARLSGGYISAAGLLDLESRDFQAQGEVGQIDLARLPEAFHVTDARITGSADANFDAAGNLKDVNRLRVEASALGRQITINERQAGALRLTAHTSPGGRVDVELVTGIAGKPQPVIAGIELRQPGRPIEVKAGLKDFDFAPIVALFSPDVASSLSGAISGDLHVAGPIFDRDDNLTPDGLRGALTVNSIAVRVADSPINVETPAAVSLNGPQITLDTVRLTGRGTDLRIDGVIGLREGEGMNFALNGAVNLELLNRFTPDVSFGGSVAIQQRITGTAGAPKLTGELRLQDFSLSKRDSPVTLENGNGRIVLSDGQARLEDFAAQANDGRVQVSGTMKIERWRPSEWEFSVTADDVDVAYRGVRATANGALTLTGTPQGQTLAGAVTVPSAQYSTDFGLEELLANQGGRLEFGGFGDQRGEAGPSRFPRIGLNVRVEAPDSFVIRNDQVNTVASALLRLSGTTGRPAVSGRVTFEGGAIRFRGYRYEISSGTLDLPGGGAAPALNLQADGEISGYRVAIGFNGPLNDLELSLRSEPQLARTEILALITTGRTEAGAPGSGELARASLGTAVSLLSEEFISKPVTREARPVLGINRFQIDPVLRPNANPAARLTIGAQLARNLSFTYSTSLASEPEQTALGEYIITNRYSAIAAFQQGGSATRQGSRDNEGAIEFRGRRRFAPGAEPAEVVVPPAAVPPRSERLLQRAATTVNMPEGLGLGDRKLRELLPIMRESYSRALMRLGERNLTTHFQERGYFFAEVRARCEPANCSGPDLRVFYDVSPGERYRLDEIRINGTSRLDRDEARAQLQSREKALAGGVPFFEKLPLVGGTARGVTSNERLRSDRELIRRRMADLGFRAARVESRLAIKPDANDLIVVFDVDEGARSIIAGIAVRGNLVIPASELRAVLPAKEGETFSLTRAREGERRIRDLYAGRGYLEASSDLSVVDLPDGRAQLVYTVNEGDRIVAQEISFTGGAITHTDAIRGFIDFKPGEALTPLKLRRAQRALYDTGAFREINIQADPISGDEKSGHRITLNVAEAKPLLFVYGLGYSTEDGPRAMAQLTHTNLFGRLNSGSLRLRGSRREQLAQLQFITWRPFGHNWPVTISAFYNRNSDLRPFVRQRLVGGKLESDTAGRSFGINRFATFIQTERKLGEATSLRFQYNFENAKLFDLQNIPEIEVTRNERAIRLGVFTAGFARDTRDSALNPTRGQLFGIDHSVAARLLGGNESYNKFFGAYQRYDTLTVLGNSTIAVSARIGLAANFKITDRDGDGAITEPERRLPISERFFSGGATTLRGFRFEDAGPQGVLKPRNEGELPTLAPLGGDALAIFNFEFRYPLTKRLRLVPFYDLGNVFRRARDIGFGGITNTVGLGLRINTPIGPVGVDYGFLLDPPSFVIGPDAVIRRPRGVFHIRIGQTF